MIAQWRQKGQGSSHLWGERCVEEVLPNHPGSKVLHAIFRTL